MSKRVISKSSKCSRKEKKITQEDTSPIVAPIEVTWGCLISSSDIIEFSKESHILGHRESDGNVCEFTFIVIIFFSRNVISNE